MKRLSLAAAVTGLVLAAGGTVATAAPGFADPGSHGPGGHGHGHSHGTGQLAGIQRQVAHLVANKDSQLTRIEESPGFAALATDDVTTLTVAIEADRASLADLATQAAAATTVSDAKALAADVRAFRPAKYRVAIALVNDAAAVTDQVAADETTAADLSSQADTLEAGGADVSAVRADLTDAAAADQQAGDDAVAAHTAALLITATSDHTAIQTATAPLEDAGVQLGLAADALTAAQEAIDAL